MKELQTLLMDESMVAIYVADYETDELIYMNEAAKKVLNIQGDIKHGEKCYKCVMNNDVPCPFCHKSMFNQDTFIDNVIKFPLNGRYYKISSKLVNWNNRKLHIHYIIDVSNLMDEEKKLRTLTDYIPTGIVVYYAYPDGRLEAGYINDGYYKMIDSERDERSNFVGFATLDAISPEDVPLIRAEIKAGIQENRQMYIETRIRRDDGTYKWVSIRGEIYSKTKEKVTIYCVFSDIDALKKAQKEQEERQRHYEEEIRLKTSVTGTVKVLAIGDLTSNTVGEKEIQNYDFTVDVSGKNIDEFVDSICDDYIYPDERDEYKKVFSRKKMLSDYMSGNVRGTFRHQLKGYPGWYESAYDLVFNPYNEHIEAIASIRNVTETVRSELVIDTLMKTDYESIITIDAQTGKPTILEDSQLLYGVIEEQEIIGDNVKGVENYLRKYCTDDDIDRVIRETNLSYILEKLKTEPVHSTMYSIKVDGNVVRKRAIYAFTDSSHRTLFCARQDITKNYIEEQKKNQRLEKALIESKTATLAKDEFFAHMSHDMRTPLNGILGSVTLAIDEEEHTPAMAEYLHDIQFSGEFLLNLINDILDISKIENDAMILTPEPYQYTEFIDNMTKMIEPLCRKKNITLNMNPLETNTVVFVDILRFQQIFFNIFSNAVKYTSEGGTIDHYTEVEPIDENHIDCKCHICDNGIGMSEEFQNQLFEPYTRGTSQASVQGTGLGLTIANKLVHMMGGDIKIISELGKGTEVIIHNILEVVNQPSQNKEETSKTKKIDESTLKNVRILMFEDHPINAKIGVKILEKQGFRVDLAVNGKEGCEKFKNSSKGFYQVILMDIRMPIMDGLEATRTIRKMEREDAKTIPIIAMTANAYESDIQECMDAGMNDHIAKPIDSKVMYEKIVASL